MSRIPHTPANSKKIGQLAEQLQGTTLDLDEMIRVVFNNASLEMTDLDMELLGELDDKVLLCNGCNWWVETAEIDNNDSGDQLCTDCTESP